MELSECTETLYRVARVRLPSFIRVGRMPREDGVPEEEKDRPIPLAGREKIEQLESYLLETAEARQQAHEARLYVSAALKDLRVKYRNLEGWEAHLNGEKKPSEAAKHLARRMVDQDLFESIESGEWLMKELDKQISRLQHDDDVVSRAYTFITGG